MKNTIPGSLSLFLITVAALVPSAGIDAGTVLQAGDATVWKYFDNGTQPGAGWQQPGFDDSQWKSGKAPLGYGEPGLGTEVSFGGNPARKLITTWFRHEFDCPELAVGEKLVLSLCVDDGAVVYLNGAEVDRVNMPADPVNSGTPAQRKISGAEEGYYLRRPVPAGAIHPGKRNLLAVEVHQDDPMSSDLFLDMSLKVVPAEPPSVEVAPAALEVVNLFNKRHFVGPGVRIPDGYLDGGRRMHLDAQRHPTADREILWVDRARDSKLAADLAFARARELRALPPLERIERIAARIHGETTPPGGIDKVIGTADQLEAEFRNKPILIGDWVDQAQAGACRHRALLFKILGDEAGLDVALVRGNYGGGSPSGRAWNEVLLGDGRRVIVDVMLDLARPRCLEVTAPEVIENYLRVDDSPWYGVGKANRPRPAARVGDELIAKLLYRGFTVDISALDHVKDAGQTLMSLKHQIDTVAAVRVKPEVARFFSTVLIKLGDVGDASLGVYDAGTVVLTTDPINPDRGVLIHELLHAYHAEKMGAETKKRVTAYYEEAPRAYNLPRTEYALSNEHEFFAVTGSIYLRGTSSRKPHDRPTIQAKQPEYYKFLGELFDP